MSLMSISSKSDSPPLINGATVIRLERELEEQKKTVSPLRDDVNVLKLEYVGMQRDMSSLAANAKADNTGLAESLRSLSTRFDESRKPNIPAIIGVFGLLPALVAGMFYIFNGNVSSALVPIEIRTTGFQQAQVVHDREISALQLADIAKQHEIASLQQSDSITTSTIQRHDAELRKVSENLARGAEVDSSSISDRVQLNTRMKRAEELLATGMSERLSNQAKVAAALTEIETQFKDIMRYIIILWERSFKARFPSDLDREVVGR